MTETDYIVDRLQAEIKTLPEQKNQCTQHLIELGYIPISIVNTLRDNDLEFAKIEFFEEAKASGLYNEKELTRHIFEEEEEFLADLLEKAVDIDEGITFDKLPEKGEQNLHTRIIHYRLDLFGMWEQAVQTKYSLIYSFAKLSEIAAFAKCNPLEALNHLADVEGFTKQLLKVRDDEEFILAFQSKKQVSDKLINDLDYRNKFKKQLIEDFSGRSDFFKYLKREVLNKNIKNIDFDFLRKEALNPFKQFVLRLIQVHQWQDGLYDGLLDSDIGEVTLQSIMNSVELYNLAGKRGIKLFRVLTYTGNGFFLFNALFFLQEYMVEDESDENVKDAEGTIINDVLDAAESADNLALAAFQLNMDALKFELAQASVKKPEEKKGLLKRIYFGIKKFFKKIISVSKKIFGWVVKYAKQFWGILKKVFGHFFQKLAKGIKAFVDGMKFLLGKKSTVTATENGLIASVIRLDGDAFNMVTADASLLVAEHTHKIRYSVTSLDFALTIVGGVLNIVLKAISVVSWPMLIFAIIKIFRNISESYKKLEFITT